MKNKKAFTIIELVIVILIISALAAIAVPTMFGQRKKASSAEAIAAMGIIRKEIQITNRLGQTLPFSVNIDADFLTGINSSDMNGQYYNTNSYEVNLRSMDNYIIIATPINSDNAIRIFMDEDGTVYWDFHGASTSLAN